MSDATVDRLLADTYRSMRGVLESQPPQRTLLQVSRLQLELWSDTIAGVQLLLAHPVSTRLELAGVLGVVGFLAGVLVGWYSR